MDDHHVEVQHVDDHHVEVHHVCNWSETTEPTAVSVLELVIQVKILKLVK